MQRQGFITSENIHYFKIVSFAKCKKYHGESLQIEDIEHFRDCKKEVEIPSSFFDEIEQYGQRNVIWIENTIHGKPCMHGRVCLRCLKAFSIHKAEELCLKKEVIKFISERFDCETGHSGYFLNNGEPLQAY